MLISGKVFVFNPRSFALIRGKPLSFPIPPMSRDHGASGDLS